MLTYGLPMVLFLLIFVLGLIGVARQVISKWGSLDVRRRWCLLTVMICLFVFVGGLSNFIVFWIVSSAIGGDALNGEVVDGRYYVSNHGRLTEVSRGMWVYLWYHGWSTDVTHLLAFLAFLVMVVAKRIFGLAGQPDPRFSIGSKTEGRS